MTRRNNLLVLFYNTVPDNTVPDTTAPTLEITSTESSPTTAWPIPIVFTFSEPVTGFTVDDITIPAGVVLVNFAGSGAVYTVDLYPAGNGAVTVDIAANVCVDGAGNNNTAATQFSITSAAFALPSDIAGQTGWWDASEATTLFTDAGETQVTMDADAVHQMNDQTAGARHFTQSFVGTYPLYKTNRQNGKSGLLFDGTNDYMQSVAISNFIANNAYCLFVVFKPINITTADANINDNDAVFADASGYIGAFLKSVPMTLAALYNFDGSVDETAGVPISTNAGVLLTIWHSGGSIYLQKNDESPVSVASGNTSVLTGALRIMANRAAPGQLLNGDFYEMSVHNAVPSDAERQKVNHGLMAKWAVGPYLIPDEGNPDLLGTPHTNPEAWTPVFEDSFANLNNWDINIPTDRYWSYKVISDDVALLEGGGLRLIGSGDLDGGFYETGGIVSKNTYLYGYFEMRARIPSGAVHTGLWPNFWLWDSNTLDSTNAEQVANLGPEIDVIEYIGGNLEYYVGSWDSIPRIKINGEVYIREDPSLEYHTYACRWRDGEIKYYYDGAEYITHTIHIPGVPLYAWAQMGLGGWAGVPDSELLPYIMDIESIKIWQEV